MLKNRVLTAIIGAPLVLLFVYLGTFWLFFCLLIIAFFSLKEYFSLLGFFSGKAPLKFLSLLGYAGVFLVLALVYLELFNKLTLLFVACFIFLIFYYLLFFPGVKLWELALTMWGIIYIGGFSAYVLALRHLDDGLVYVLLLIIGTWANDVGAYFIGVRFGKHRFAPRISPKKSVEGAIGGILSSALFLESLVQLLPDFFFLSAGYGVLLGTVIAVFGQIGDLSESAIKREACVKDSGVALPGHGGFLDRVDSLLFTAPVFYYIVLLFL